MKFELEGLCRPILLEIFSYVDARELLEVRFLNKELFSIVQNAIKYNLYYSNYSSVHSFKEIQHDFIKKYPSKIKHLEIYDGLLPSYLRMNKSIQTLEDTDANFYLNNNYYNYNNQFINLLSLTFDINRRIDEERLTLILNYFKELLFKVRKLNLITTCSINLDTILSLLNPEKLNGLKIENSFCEENIELINISIFRKFKHLEQLEFNTVSLYIKSKIQLSLDVVIFSSLKSLRLHGFRSLDFKLFGNISHLKELHLDLPEAKLEEFKILVYLKGNKLSKVSLNLYVSNIPFKECDFEIEHLKFIQKIISKTRILIKGAHDTRGGGKFEDISIFLNVEEVIFIDCKLNIHCIFNMLQYFPNIKKVNFKKGCLFTYSKVPLLLPNNPKSFLFCFNRKLTDFDDEDDVLYLLNAIPTYIY